MCARQVCCIHIDALANNLSLIQRYPAVHEDRCKQNPDHLLLCSRCLERLHLELDEVLSEKGSKVGPHVVVVWLRYTFHVNHAPDRIVD